MAKRAKSTQPATTTPDEDVSWLDADKNYSLGLDRGKIVCRNPAGKRLASVPKELKESELGEQLSALSEWLVEHRTECEHRIEMWMLRSLPVPREVIQAVWTDTDWSDMLRNLAVIPVDANGKANSVKTGLLRDVHPQKGVGVVDRDGETQWLTSAQILIPHPILIEGLEDLREIVADMGFVQQVEQLFRPVFGRDPRTKEAQQNLRLFEWNVRSTEFRQFTLSTTGVSGTWRLGLLQGLGKHEANRSTLLGW